MRPLAIFLLFLSFSAVAKEKDYIVVPVKVQCFKLDKVLAELKHKYGEDPVFVGKSDLETGSATMMFINQETGSYTVLAAGKGVGCVYDVGSDVRYRLPKALEQRLL